MKNQKINLRKINVKSFITTIDHKTYRTIKGGTIQHSEGCENTTTDDPTLTETAGAECANLHTIQPCISV